MFVLAKNQKGLLSRIRRKPGIIQMEGRQLKIINYRGDVVIKDGVLSAKGVKVANIVVVGKVDDGLN
ncbi:hypothetical protein VNO78_05676 [Psophocarpus tetragonolobus]|uniref:Uncharacterized protein n=1 Tax=Psophocarpus tetragonolobus TaxID=3891 RepID=A0AAN9SU59_PSOTE